MRADLQRRHSRGPGLLASPWSSKTAPVHLLPSKEKVRYLERKVNSKRLGNMKRMATH
jgi:hypothetical protein